jgi:hypothetical protein
VRLIWSVVGYVSIHTPAFGLRRQPELCQQAAEVVISPLRTKSPLAWFQGDKQVM